MNHRISAPVTMILILVIIVITLLDWIFGFYGAMAVPFQIKTAWGLLLEGVVIKEVLLALGTTVSCAFLHANIGHLMSNMILLWVFGCVLEQFCGWRWMVTIFLLTAIGATLGQMVGNTESLRPMVGASGGLMGCEGAYLGFAMRCKLPNPHVWPMARPVTPLELAGVGVIGIILDSMGIIEQSPGDNIAHGAHIGGFITGILVSFLRRD